MSQHTKGRWRVGQTSSWDDEGNPVNPLAIYSQDGIKIARVETWRGEQERAESEANARLIAAAPELLEALRDVTARCEAYYGSEYPATKRGLAAIAKAEGRA